MSTHRRMPISITTQRQGFEFIKALGGLNDSFSIENFDGSARVDARSMMGVLYALSEMAEDMYLVNNTNDGEFPITMEQYRK